MLRVCLGFAFDRVAVLVALMPNALSAEKSPYLLQHAGNPVDWLPWGETAFDRARSEQKPVLLSIGYSTCHWCHVMAHESFENPAVAELLNTHFIPIKVDREERPDVDKVYMAYVQALTGHGGWPLNVWLTPELKPFFGGTYFPPEDRAGRAGFPSILRAVARGWAEERDKLVAEADRVLALLRGQATDAQGAAGGSVPDLAEAAGDAFERCYQYLNENYDAAQGGFGGAPKFPRSGNLNFLFRCAILQGIDSGTGREAVAMAGGTVAGMARGGIHDHVGGGFHRYAVDDAWFVPHFEKMLYDQAQIAVNALDAFLFTGRDAHAWLARDILDYVLRDLTGPAGGFYSAEDADSAPAGQPERHVEGAFYVWTQEELESVLGADAAIVVTHYGVRPDGNVPRELDPHGEFTGRNILRQRGSILDTAKAHGLDPEDAATRIAAALERLRAVRAQRPRPLLDDKIITAWNGLMIGAFARGSASPAACLADKREFYREAARRAAALVKRELYDADRGVLYRSYREGRGASEGFAEDYAFMIAGLLDLYEGTFEVEWLDWAERLQRTMDARYWDGKGGGYFNSADDDASIVLRLKEDYDGAEPSPNSVAASNLLRLAGIFQDEALRTRALQTLAAFQPRWSRIPQALPEMMGALERALEAPRQIVLAGDPGSGDFDALADVVRERPGPRRVLLAADQALAARLPWLATMKPVNGRATAYVCEHYACQAPVTEPAALRALLG